MLELLYCNFDDEIPRISRAGVLDGIINVNVNCMIAPKKLVQNKVLLEKFRIRRTV